MREFGIDGLVRGQSVIIKDANGKSRIAVCLDGYDYDPYVFCGSDGKNIVIPREQAGQFRFYRGRGHTREQGIAFGELVGIHNRKRSAHVVSKKEVEARENIRKSFTTKKVDIRKRLYDCMRRLDPKATEYSEILVGNIRINREFLVGKADLFNEATLKVSKRIPNMKLLGEAIQAFKSGKEHTPGIEGIEVYGVSSSNMHQVKQRIRIVFLEDGETVVGQVISELIYINRSCSDNEIQNVVEMMLLR